MTSEKKEPSNWPTAVDGIPEQEHDPVCDCNVAPVSAAATSVYKGKTYYFCTLGCKKAFDKDPEKYL